MPKRAKRPSWNSQKALQYRADYRSMLTRMGIDISEIEIFGDAAEILQSMVLEDNKGYKVRWFKGPIRRGGENVYDIHMEISSISEPKSRPYDVKAVLFENKGKKGKYTTSYNDFDHACAESQFASKYRWSGGVVSADHHMILARRMMEKRLPEWCHHHDVPKIDIPRLYVEFNSDDEEQQFRKKELLEILTKEGNTLKSIELRQRIYVYLTEHGIKLYGFDLDDS